MKSSRNALLLTLLASSQVVHGIPLPKGDGVTASHGSQSELYHQHPTSSSVREVAHGGDQISLPSSPIHSNSQSLQSTYPKTGQAAAGQHEHHRLIRPGLERFINGEAAEKGDVSQDDYDGILEHGIWQKGSHDFKKYLLDRHGLHSSLVNSNLSRPKDQASAAWMDEHYQNKMDSFDEYMSKHRIEPHHEKEGHANPSATYEDWQSKDIKKNEKLAKAKKKAAEVVDQVDLMPAWTAAADIRKMKKLHSQVQLNEKEDEVKSGISFKAGHKRPHSETLIHQKK